MNCEEKSTPMPKLDRSGIVRRIDVISQELTELRRLVENAFPSERSSSITAELLGCLGSEAIDEYDFSIDWKRFG